MNWIFMREFVCLCWHKVNAFDAINLVIIWFSGESKMLTEIFHTPREENKKRPIKLKPKISVNHLQQHLCDGEKSDSQQAAKAICVNRSEPKVRTEAIYWLSAFLPSVSIQWRQHQRPYTVELTEIFANLFISTELRESRLCAFIECFFSFFVSVSCQGKCN